MFTTARLYVAGAILATMLGGYGYIKYLQSEVNDQEIVIANAKTEVVVYKKSEAADDLSHELEVDMAIAKGKINEVEINTTVGYHTYDFDSVLSKY